MTKNTTPITLKNLLNHTSGLSYRFNTLATYDPVAARRKLAEQRLKAQAEALKQEMDARAKAADERKERKDTEAALASDVALAKREKEIAELEGKLVTASPEEMEKLTAEMQEYERQVASLAKKIEEVAANAAARGAA